MVLSALLAIFYKTHNIFKRFTLPFSFFFVSFLPIVAVNSRICTMSSVRLTVFFSSSSVASPQSQRSGVRLPHAPDRRRRLLPAPAALHPVPLPAGAAELHRLDPRHGPAHRSDARRCNVLVHIVFIEFKHLGRFRAFVSTSRGHNQLSCAQ